MTSVKNINTHLPFNLQSNGLKFNYHGSSGKETLFTDIVSGAYDEAIRHIAEDLQRFGEPVFIRWGHEMEYVTGRYPWAKGDSAGFIRAYRYVVDRFRGALDKAYFVWSPAGNKELHHYWPGSDWVDYVGVSVYCLPEMEREYYGEIRSFDEIFAERYERVRRFNKPVMIAELGVTGSKDFQSTWMKDALRSLSKYPQLKSVVYFNAPDSAGAWDLAYGVPDWRIDPAIFE